MHALLGRWSVVNGNLETTYSHVQVRFTENAMKGCPVWDILVYNRLNNYKGYRYSGPGSLISGTFLPRWLYGNIIPVFQNRITLARSL